jgi:hypothetical protein
MNRRTGKIAILLVVTMFAGLVFAQEMIHRVQNNGAGERHRLYTTPDPAATGGIKGVVKTPAKPIVQVLAMPPDEPRYVYEGEVTGANGQGFLFKNLPMARYNLFVIYDNEFFEGLELSREKDTLTKADQDKIIYIVNESDPFFNKKVIHRMAGTTGRGNLARCVVTEYRDKGPMRRTFKLIWLKDVGPGWQVVQKRDLYPITTDLKHMTPTHHFAAVLSRIRVTDQIKDLGEIDLGKQVLRPESADQGE